MTAEDQRGPRWHVQTLEPSGLCYGTPGTDDVWFPPLGGWPDEAVEALKAMTLGSWAGGFDSGYGEGRKAASTARMMGVFRVFDPRPLRQLLDAVNEHEAAGFPGRARRARQKLVEAVAAALESAEA